MPQLFDKGILVVLGVLLGSALASAAIAHRYMGEITANRIMTAHSREVQSALRQLLIATRDDDILAREERLRRLEQLAAGDARRENHVRALRTHIKQHSLETRELLGRIRDLSASEASLVAASSLDFGHHIAMARVFSAVAVVFGVAAFGTFLYEKHRVLTAREAEEAYADG